MLIVNVVTMGAELRRGWLQELSYQRLAAGVV